MSTSIEDLSNAIEELGQLRRNAKHPKNQKFMDEQLNKWQANLDEMKRIQVTANQNQSASKPSVGSVVRPLKKLTNYAIDESDKFVKLYYTIPGISNASADSINAKFDENCFEIHCIDCAGIDYEINVRGLFLPIDAVKCQWKQKTGDMLLVMLKKGKEGAKWESLLKLEQKEKSKKMPKVEEGEDPQASIMNLMKQMYDEGDDEMKRTIRKAWTEAQSKKDNMAMDMDF